MNRIRFFSFPMRNRFPVACIRFNAILFLILTITAISASNTVTIAVLDLKVVGFPGGSGALFADEIRGELAKNPSVRVVNRENLESVLKEHSLAQSGLMNDNGSLSAVGAAASAQYIIAGSVGKIDGTAMIHLKCIDVSSVATVCQADRKGDFSAESVLKQLRLATRELLGAMNASTINGPPSQPLYTEEKGYTLFRGGEFVMGDNSSSEDEKPAHTVTVGDFYLKTTEVTYGEYREFCKKSSYALPAKRAGTSDDMPVVFITWNDAMAYCTWYSETFGVTMRLPTEAEWEYAGKKGAQPPKLSKVKFNVKYAWYAGNSGGAIHPSQSGTPDGNGVYNLIGNVQEWCADWYGAEYYKEEDAYNPKGPENGTYRVVRGGSAFSNAKDLGLGRRSSKFPDYSFNDVGFRPVIEPKKK